MKKKLLFIIPSLDAGGGEKSLVNLMNVIDFDKYEVDLFLFKSGGLFMPYVPKEVNIIYPGKNHNLFTLPIDKSILSLIKNKEIKLITSRVKFTINNKRNLNTSRIEQYGWKYLSKSLDKLDKKYDTAIAFLEKTSIYFCVDKVCANKKIGFIHNDYNELGMDYKFDLKYFKELDHIVTVSDKCEKVLKEIFKGLSHKISTVHNITSPKMIKEMSKQEIIDLSKNNDEIVILSIGRLVYQKGFELAIESCKYLIDKGYNIKWYVIGEGDERTNLELLIKNLGLDDKFILLGLKSNPYPYIKNSDIYVQTSRFEGKSIAIDEAKILNKPIIVTNYTTAKDQINDKETGFIVERNIYDVSNAIETLINDNRLRDEFCNNLSMIELGTEEEIFKLYDLIK